MAALQSSEGDTLARLSPGLDLLSLTLGQILKLAANIWETRIGLLYISNRREVLERWLRGMLPRCVDMAVEFVVTAPSSAQSFVAPPSLSLQTQPSTSSSTSSSASSYPSSGSSTSPSSSIDSPSSPHDSSSLHVASSELERPTQQPLSTIPVLIQASPLGAPASDAPQATDDTSTIPAYSPSSTTTDAPSTALPPPTLVPLPYVQSPSPLLFASTSLATDDAPAASSNFTPLLTSSTAGTTSPPLAPAAPVGELPYFVERLLYGGVGELSMPPDVMSRKNEWEELVTMTNGITDYQAILDLLATSETGRCTSTISFGCLASVRDG